MTQDFTPTLVRSLDYIYANKFCYALQVIFQPSQQQQLLSVVHKAADVAFVNADQPAVMASQGLLDITDIKILSPVCRFFFFSSPSPPAPPLLPHPFLLLCMLVRLKALLGTHVPVCTLRQLRNKQRASASAPSKAAAGALCPGQQAETDIQTYTFWLCGCA